jgi:hypothetical protein
MPIVAEAGASCWTDQPGILLPIPAIRTDIGLKLPDKLPLITHDSAQGVEGYADTGARQAQ